MSSALQTLAVGFLCLAHSLAAAEAPTASAKIAALDRVIMVRTSAAGKVYGEDEVDPLVWRDSDYFLSGPSRARLLAALEGVNALADAEVRRCAPAQRALAQNRVWRVFDHVQQDEGTRTSVDQGLLHALVKAMTKLALDRAEMESIPDPLAEAASSGRWPAQPEQTGGPDVFLPGDLGRLNGRWETLGRADGELTGKLHTVGFGGRSLFLLRARFPESAPSPQAYFKAIADAASPWRPTGDEGWKLNPDLPTLPKDAEFALIRRLAVIDRAGRWRATPLTVSVQIRRYRITDREDLTKLEAAIFPSGGVFRQLQSFAEFELETTAVAAGGPARLRPIQAEDKRFMFFFAHSFDQVDGTKDLVPAPPGFPSGPVDQPMQRCANCHAGLGLQSINSATLAFESTPTPVGRLPRLVAGSAEREAGAVGEWKARQPEWKALHALWPAVEGGQSRD